MNLQRLSRLDLNLLVALQALLEEKSVTRAAQRLFITQPAMSRVLQRLRQQLDDPLFTRTGNELIPTPKARDLELRLPGMLEDILDMVTEGEFDPAAYVGEITIAIPEFIAISLASQLTAVLNQYAPGVILSISSETDSVEGELADGVLDFAIDIQKEISSDIGTRDLAIFSPSIWMRTGHPLAEKAAVTLDEILAYPFVQYYLLISKRVSARTDARFDRALRELGRMRKKAMVTNQLMTAIETVCRTDSLMVAAKFGSGMEHELYSIVSKSYPDDLPHEGTIPLVLLQHKRTMGSPIHRWLSEKIVDLARAMDEV
ncbi:MAG: LysR family transcriptional regulator [Porticoccaceae bacterium]|jgi:DNA-binding transcriptional LysR family regulator|nr:MAG: LysR family transcriptional regulator [SAR92 bacterium BACL16 MAG-120619-bin48]KRP25743.1 MAG: LysR family transcriptional regulator [SAR92 bacterium BACL16 MAG-120322-bin99]MDP4653598.1 LysR family transcriptional regulator [Alphaproteobacteria bacterium]MDP4743911.1 LysR family transcriptional regulator [Porticoccaceae bacterium]MDP4752476.1 LysR family transcriptional regulator [Porticoccaceae bacterium]|tara:strand:- start:601 stop:1548 length:948 start_codon:yes stop_codon:yes gene_type:complete